jgi:hypothetical protein
MVERGVWLIAAPATTVRSQASAQLGLTLRSVLLSPRAGFASVFASARRREQTGARPAEGVAPYVLAALGGMALMILWLKLGSLLSLREVAAADFRWSYLAVAAVAGALVALVTQLIWGYVGAAIVRAFGAHSPARDLRVAWGASAFPHVIALLVLLPLDLVIVGTDTFTSERLDDPLATGWAALSIAFSASLAVWSAFIFVRGVEVATSTPVVKAIAISFVALGCLAAIVGGSIAVATALSGGA